MAQEIEEVEIEIGEEETEIAVMIVIEAPEMPLALQTMADHSIQMIVVMSVETGVTTPEIAVALDLEEDPEEEGDLEVDQLVAGNFPIFFVAGIAQVFLPKPTTSRL